MQRARVYVGDDLFAVSSEDDSQYNCFLHLFDVDTADGSLCGVRVKVNGATSSQTAFRKGTGTPEDFAQPGQLAGTYLLEASDEYNGERLKVKRLPIDAEDAYSFRWSGGAELEGSGVREADTIAVVARPVGQMRGTCGSITYTKDTESGQPVGTFYTLASLKGTTPRRRGEETASSRE